jgi:hypothetical protein
VGKDIDRPLTRSELNRVLIGNALTKPFPNIMVPTALAIGGIVAGLGTIAIIVAVVAWVALSAITYFDGDEAQRVGDELKAKRRSKFEKANPRVTPAQLAPPIGERLNEVIKQHVRITAAIEKADLPFAEVTDEVDVFVRAAEKTASRAQLLYEYLSEQDPRAVTHRLNELRRSGDPSKQQLVEALEQQERAFARAEQQLDRFYTEMERIGVELGNIRGELLSVSAASEAAGQQRLAAEVRDLRDQMGAVSAGMSEALEQTADA